MNKKVYILAIAAFVVGTVELILGGILDLIAADLHLTLTEAGHFISMFSLVYAISAPVLLNLTAKYERKQVYMWTLAVFFISNIISGFSHSFGMLMLGRVIGAASGSLIFVLSLVLAARMVEPAYKGRAVGMIAIGGSASLIVGVPLGIFIGNLAGWREVFLFIAVLTGVVILTVGLTMGRMQPVPVVPLKMQLSALLNRKMAAIHLTTLLVLAGSLTLYAYFTPFLQEALGATSTMVAFIYVMYGIAAVAGGGLGGFLSDKLHPAKAIVIVLAMFMLSMAAVPLGVKLPLALCLGLLGIWGALSWMVTPVQNSLIIHLAPNTYETLISTNSGMAHAGIALGTYIGGVVISQSSVIHTGWVGSFLILLGLITSLYAISRKDQAVQAAS